MQPTVVTRRTLVVSAAERETLAKLVEQAHAGAVIVLSDDHRPLAVLASGYSPQDELTTALAETRWDASTEPLFIASQHLNHWWTAVVTAVRAGREVSLTEHDRPIVSVLPPTAKTASLTVSLHHLVKHLRSVLVQITPAFSVAIANHGKPVALLAAPRTAEPKPKAAYKMLREHLKLGWSVALKKLDEGMVVIVEDTPDGRVCAGIVADSGPAVTGTLTGKFADIERRDKAVAEGRETQIAHYRWVAARIVPPEKIAAFLVGEGVLEPLAPRECAADEPATADGDEAMDVRKGPHRAPTETKETVHDSEETSPKTEKSESGHQEREVEQREPIHESESRRETEPAIDADARRAERRRSILAAAERRLAARRGGDLPKAETPPAKATPRRKAVRHREEPEAPEIPVLEEVDDEPVPLTEMFARR